MMLLLRAPTCQFMYCRNTNRHDEKEQTKWPIQVISHDGSMIWKSLVTIWKEMLVMSRLSGDVFGWEFWKLLHLKDSWASREKRNCRNFTENSLKESWSNQTEERDICMSGCEHERGNSLKMNQGKSPRRQTFFKCERRVMRENSTITKHENKEFWSQIEKIHSWLQIVTQLRWQ